MSTTATKASTNNMPVIEGVKPEVISMAAAIQADMKLDTKTGTVEVGKDLYKRLLPEDLTVETVERVQEHNTLFAAASGLALGEVAVPAMKKHKELDRASVSIPATGKDAFNHNFDRERQVPDRKADGTTGTKTKYGSLSSEFAFYGAKSRGQMNKVKEHIGAKAVEAFGKL